jgi:hypothetical protein
MLSSDGVPPAKLLGKLSRRALDKQLVLKHGYWNCFRFPMDLGFQECFSSGLDFRIRFTSGFDRVGFSGSGSVF